MIEQSFSVSCSNKSDFPKNRYDLYSSTSMVLSERQKTYYFMHRRTI